ncbi:MAG: hypothetical protein QNL33_10680 [Akkermansiaceae bacterium]|jgi:hypothetical protein
MNRVILNFRWIPLLPVCLAGPGNAQNRQDLPPPKVDEVVEAVTDTAKFDLDEIEGTVEAFLNAETVTERLKYVRDGERVLPLMKKHYGGEKIEPEGFKSFEPNAATYRASLMTAKVETGDYSTLIIAVERVVVEVIGEDEVVYKVDWESWVGFCEMSVEDMRRAQPTEPVLLRALVSSDSYYNFSFNDDEKWDSYRLLFRNSDETLSGYVKVGSEASKQLADLRRANERITYTLKVVYPTDGRSKSQVKIVEVVQRGWVIEMWEEKKDGK